MTKRETAAKIADARTAECAAETRNLLARGDLAMARHYRTKTVEAWEVSTGYVLRRGELARFVAAHKERLALAA